MKIRRTLLACLAFGIMQASAQEPTSLLRSPDYNKPKRFADLPDKQLLRTHELEQLLLLPVGATVSVPVSKLLTLRGTIVSVSSPTDKMVKSVVIKSTNRPGTSFTFTRITEKDGTYSYTGRMLGREVGDALEIVREGGSYVVRKKPVHEMISE